MNLYTKQKQTDRQRKQTYGYQGGREGGGINSEFGINIYTLLYVKQITNKDLLYSTGNCTQYFVITYKGKKSEKKIDIYVCITESLCYTSEIQHCKSTILQFFKKINKKRGYDTD